ncbi:HAUS augmin-like complex subunit 8 [Microcaecilia unicolor]|uniref:HAUS augmin-like complex subunit 8 n=1 Tax=Microcaecilia unicolor TaxID=1415580 RepID=A0A6P7ZEZ0_9AMPH|nr:HAUS augmin-like complex subunit 8 [Microcaecilia unicolor]
MAESGVASLEDGANRSGSNDPTVKKTKGVRFVKARYMQYDKRKLGKSNLVNSTAFSGAKIPEKAGSGTPTRKSCLLQKLKIPTAGVSNALDGAELSKNDLQSTLMEGDKLVRPDLDLSAVVNERTFHRNTPKSLVKAEQRTPKMESLPLPAVPEGMIGMLESQTLLLSYLSLKMQKNISRLEEKAEKNLLLVCEEKENLQQKVYEQKRKLLLCKKDLDLAELLAKQAEVLTPSFAEDNRFKNDYKAFATALDSTRHELPMKHIHAEGNRQKYLDELQQHLAVTEKLLAVITPDCSEENSKAFNAAKELEEVTLKIDTDLPRSLALVLNLSYKVSKETALQNQKVTEETQSQETVKPWYFDE